MPVYPRPPEERFWAKLDRSNLDGCWLWTGATHKNGHGVFNAGDGHTVNTHKFAYEIAVGPVPDGLCVYHSCEHPSCCRPSHLYLGSRSEGGRKSVAKIEARYGREWYAEWRAKRQWKPLAERLWAKVQIGPPTACWSFTGHCDPDGYGVIVHRRRPFRAHRVAYLDARGPIPPGMLVCHSCDNPPCCNPNHLWLGTNSDNIMDMVAKGRARGPAIHFSGGK